MRARGPDLLASCPRPPETDAFDMQPTLWRPAACQPSNALRASQASQGALGHLRRDGHQQSTALDSKSGSTNCCVLLVKVFNLSELQLPHL